MASGVSGEPEETHVDEEFEKDDKMTNSNGHNSAQQQKENKESETSGEAFDLTNPEVLINQLEQIDLTEEDTEELLHEAYKVNMKLKEILRRQEAKKRDRLSSAKSAYSTGKPSKSGSAVLPPIQRRGSGKGSTSSANRMSPKKGSEEPHRPRRSLTSKSTRDKPAWDDRFSYS